jgi:hypothetical protein
MKKVRVHYREKARYDWLFNAIFGSFSVLSGQGVTMTSVVEHIIDYMF